MPFTVCTNAHKLRCDFAYPIHHHIKVKIHNWLYAYHLRSVGICDHFPISVNGIGGITGIVGSIRFNRGTQNKVDREAKVSISLRILGLKKVRVIECLTMV